MATFNSNNIVHNEVTTVESRVLSGVHSFVWKINGFKEIWQNFGFLENLYFKFQIGEDIGFPSTFRVSIRALHVAMNNRTYYSLQCEKALNPCERQLVDVPCYMNIEYQLADPLNNETLCTGTAPFVEIRLPWGDSTSVSIPFFDRITNIDDFPVKDDCLIIYLTCKLKILQTVATTLVDKKELFEAEAILNLSKNVEAILEDTSTDITIISKDNQEFKAHKTILIGKNDVLTDHPESHILLAMLNPCWTEGRSNIIKLADISSHTIRVLLHFIYSGTLHPDWANREVADELTYGCR
ncbi:BTB/POZ domain-containing protein 8 [Orchesella cincta]|uniref:BTB/POZ domain-containing protein 8 n=1 Tax=Orchesella cincta TaxID=48709 RepID=A0A1D2MGD8_ORCCI|nr:BTB/POZ domain-containing protein 8 [Orchesella cincta]